MVANNNPCIAILQLNPTVGAIQANLTLIAGAYLAAVQQGADLVITPECVLSGYPPEDLLLSPDFRDALREAVHELTAQTSVPLILGTPWPRHNRSAMPSQQVHWQNSALLLQNRTLTQKYAKRALPNYGVFDERRWFATGSLPAVWNLEIGDTTCRLGVTICEDIWDAGIRASLPECDLLVNLSASPFEHGKWQQRRTMMQRATLQSAARAGIYCNLTGAQDELVFDGHSFVLHQDNCTLLAQTDTATAWTSMRENPDTDQKSVLLPSADFDPQIVIPLLTIAVRDYVHKSGFSQVLIGLSGGIDSALVLALAVEALGADNVLAASMPSRFSSDETRNDAKEQAEHLGVPFEEIAIESLFNQSLDSLAGLFGNTSWDLTEENLQARLRGVLLMAISNKQNRLLLTTGNKSEYAVGYATLYGDMNGAFAPLKDLYKTEVFALSRWWKKENGDTMILPSIIERPPSAELRDDQRDDQSLPPYPVLDRFLRGWIDQRQAAHELVHEDFSANDVARWIRAVRMSEYKRRQAPPGPKLTANAFGRERRLPIINKFEP